MDSELIPIVWSKRMLNRLEKLESQLRSAAQVAVAATMQQQVASALERFEGESFVVVALSVPPEMLEIGRAKLSLIKATRHCQNKPILVLAWDDGHLAGRCSVPQVSV